MSELRGCALDTDGDGNCHRHPRGCPPGSTTADPREEGCPCHRCGRRYKVDVLVPDSLWAKISPKPVGGDKGGGLLCPPCIGEALEQLGEFDAFSLVQPPVSLVGEAAELEAAALDLIAADKVGDGIRQSAAVDRFDALVTPERVLTMLRDAGDGELLDVLAELRERQEDVERLSAYLVEHTHRRKCETNAVEDAILWLRHYHTLRPRDDWHDDDGPVLWWSRELDEIRHVGTPNDSDWYDDSDDAEPYVAFFTPIPNPAKPKEQTDG